MAAAGQPEYDLFLPSGLQQAQLRLHPEELGSLNIHLKIEDNQAVMHFVSPHSHVRAAMESMMPVLRNALQEKGSTGAKLRRSGVSG